MHKKCPFCGGEPEYATESEFVSVAEEAEYGYVRCTRCGARSTPLIIVSYDFAHDACGYPTPFATEKDVWALWDKRVTENG